MGNKTKHTVYAVMCDMNEHGIEVAAIYSTEEVAEQARANMVGGYKYGPSMPTAKFTTDDVWVEAFVVQDEA